MFTNVSLCKIIKKCVYKVLTGFLSAEVDHIQVLT